jgi:hypothetical protein
MEFTGQTLQVIGEVMIGLTAIMVHRRFWKEHKIDAAVYREMKREQTVGIIGIIMLIAGYLLQVIS